MGDLFDEHLWATLLFFGAGGHDKRSGILNLRDFGVEQEAADAVELETVQSPTISIDVSSSWAIFESNSEAKYPFFLKKGLERERVYVERRPSSLLDF